MTSCQFIPPYLLQQVASADVDADIARCGHATLAIDEGLRSRRTLAPHTSGGTAVETDAAWVVHTADNGPTLPGRPERTAGQPPTGGLAVDEAYVGVEASLALFRDALGRDSYDGRGATVLATVHYEHNDYNAFWDGRQLVFGDGDGRVFDRFTKPIDVLAHELTHAVAQYAAGLVYQGQSGALNEHVSDVFAAFVKQRVLDQAPEEADWLIREGIFLPAVNGRRCARWPPPARRTTTPWWARTRRSGTCRTTSTPPTTTAACISTPGSRTARSISLRPASGVRPGSVPRGSGTPRSPQGWTPTPTSRPSQPPP